MNPTYPPVENHYYREGIYETILAILKENGINKPTRKDIASADEFHVRGAAVSMELAKEAGFNEALKILDVGCGIGGPCRMLADEFGCHATGIDLTKEYIRTATLLSELTGLQDKTIFIQADALQLPFEDNSFDVVWTQHVQMNIADKEGFYTEIKRVLKQGGRLVYYDIFKRNDEPIHYPVPWAKDASISFLFKTTALAACLASLGFTETHTTDQTAAAIAFFSAMFGNKLPQPVPALNLQVLLGADAKEKFANLFRNLKEEKVALQSGICQVNK